MDRMKAATIIGPHMGPQDAEINSNLFYKLLDEFLIPWLEANPLLLQKVFVYFSKSLPHINIIGTPKHWLNYSGLKAKK